MTILEKAIRIEEEGEKLYRKFAKQSNVQGLKEIFSFLADEEAKHRKIFRAMQSGAEAPVTDGGVIDTVKNIFKKMGDDSNKADMEHYEVGIYRKALDAEQRSIDYYKEMLDKTDENSKSIIDKIITEEKKHYRIIENIIEFTGRPQQWLDNAEWYHLEEY